MVDMLDKNTPDAKMDEVVQQKHLKNEKCFARERIRKIRLCRGHLLSEHMKQICVLVQK